MYISCMMNVFVFLCRIPEHKAAAKEVGVFVVLSMQETEDVSFCRLKCSNDWKCEILNIVFEGVRIC